MSNIKNTKTAISAKNKGKRVGQPKKDLRNISIEECEIEIDESMKKIKANLKEIRDIVEMMDKW